MRQGDANGDGTPTWGYGITGSYADPPLLPELYSAVGTARVYPGAKHVTIYAGTEITEGGPGNLIGSAQRGSSIRDAIGWARNTNSRPSTYTYGVDCHHKSWSSTGSWTWTLGQTGAFDSDELRSNSAGATRTFTHLYCTRLVLRGSTASGYGHLTVALDGGSATSISAAGATGTDVLYWDSGVLTEGSHTIVVTVTGDGTVAPDYVNVTFNPSSM
jgi:hypothetical protein